MNGEVEATVIFRGQNVPATIREQVEKLIRAALKEKKYVDGTRVKVAAKRNGSWIEFEAVAKEPRSFPQLLAELRLPEEGMEPDELAEGVRRVAAGDGVRGQVPAAARACDPLRDRANLGVIEKLLNAKAEMGMAPNAPFPDVLLHIVAPQRLQKRAVEQIETMLLGLVLSCGSGPAEGAAHVESDGDGLRVQFDVRTEDGVREVTGLRMGALGMSERVLDSALASYGLRLERLGHRGSVLTLSWYQVLDALRA